jgi:hypothetical protein
MRSLAKRDAIGLFVGASMLSLAIVAGNPPGAQAQSFNGFGPSVQYDQGLNPSATVSGVTVVEVHNGTGGVGPLWYRVGTVNASTVAWSDSHQEPLAGGTFLQVDQATPADQAGVSRNWWDHAAIAIAAAGRPMGSNR